MNDALTTAGQAAAEPTATPATTSSVPPPLPKSSVPPPLPKSSVPPPLPKSSVPPPLPVAATTTTGSSLPPPLPLPKPPPLPADVIAAAADAEVEEAAEEKKEPKTEALATTTETTTTTTTTASEDPSSTEATQATDDAREEEAAKEKPSHFLALTHALNLGWQKPVPLVLQSEAAECGLACIAMITGWHGQPYDLPELRRRFGMSLRGATLKDLSRIASALGFEARPLRLELDELGHLALPCIIHWDLNHFVVLKDVGRNHVTIHDPAMGVRKIPLDIASKYFTGIALEMAPAAGMEAVKPPPPIRFRALLGRMVGLKSSLSRVFAIAMALEIVVALSPLYMQWVIDDALVAADKDLLTTLALGFGLLLLFRTLFTAMRGWMLLAIGSSVTVQGRANLFSHLVQLPTSFFQSRHLGDVLSRFGSQEVILQALTTNIVEAALDGILALMTLALMFMFAPSLAVLVIVGAAVYVVVRWMSYAPLRNASAESIAWAAQRDTHFLETLRGMQAIKVFNAQDDRRRRWLNLLVETVNRQLTTQKLQVLFSTANLVISGVIAIAVVWLGARRVIEGSFTVGALIAFIAYKDQFLQRVTALINKALDFQMLRIHGDRLADIVLTKREDAGDEATSDGTGIIVSSKPAYVKALPEPVEQKPRAIEIQNLRFRYSENDPWVLDGIDLKIAPGESVAIVGGSGCGKTTLLKVIASLLAPTEGAVLIDGQPLNKVGIERYRNMLGVVMQDDQLFAGSIADNISFFTEKPDKALIEHCAKMASVHDAISKMPMGYATLIGDMGAALSGGQKQRILIARALYRNPSILLLDEATSHLDVKRERAVNEAISSAPVTRIIVAHRPETILSADRVIVLANGRISDEARKGEFDLSWLIHPGQKQAEPMVTKRMPAYRPPTQPQSQPRAQLSRNAFRSPQVTQRLPPYRLPPFQSSAQRPTPVVFPKQTVRIAAYQPPAPNLIRGNSVPPPPPIRKKTSGRMAVKAGFYATDRAACRR